MKSLLSLAVLALMAAISGCPMCQNPWDYCNAVIGPRGCPNCDFGARAGSKFHPMGVTPPTTEIGPTPAGAPEGESEAPAPVEESPPLDSGEPFNYDF